MGSNMMVVVVMRGQMRRADGQARRGQSRSEEEADGYVLYGVGIGSAGARPWRRTPISSSPTAGAVLVDERLVVLAGLSAF